MGEKVIQIFNVRSRNRLHTVINQIDLAFALFKLCQGKERTQWFLFVKSDCQRGGPGLGKSGDSYSKQRKGAYSCWICSECGAKFRRKLSVPHHGTERPHALMPHLQSLHSRAGGTVNAHTSGDRCATLSHFSHVAPQVLQSRVIPDPSTKAPARH